MENYQKIIFELIAIQKWSAVEEIIKNNPIDPDIRDSSGNYLIQLFIYYNQIKSLELLLKLEPRLDILDLDGKQICYLPIRYGKIELLKILLKYNTINYGIDIINFRDAQQLSPLFYAIKFNNYTIVKILLDYGARLNIYDSNKNTPLHIACLDGKDEIVKLFINHNPNIIKAINNEKQTPFHMSILSNSNHILNILLKSTTDQQSILNSQDINDRTPLMYAIELKKTELFHELLNTSMELQDANGNTHYHLAIKYNIKLDYFQKPPNTILQKTDLDGNTITHLLLINKLNNYFPDIFIHSSFLIQNSEGNTILHYLCPTKWEEYESILENQKLSIYLKNKNNETPFSLVTNTKNKKLLDKFINLIIKSYYNQLIKHTTKEYISDWENNCSIQKTKLNECYNKINQNILNGISFPQKKKNYCIDITKKMISESVYTGITLDIISGLIILNEIKKDKIQTSLQLDILSNTKLNDFYINNRIIRNDFLNFEIIWLYQTIFFPTGLDTLFIKFLKSTDRYFVIPIGIELAQGSHANILIYDKVYNSLERFEPNGSNPPNNFYYFPNELDTYIHQYFININDTIVYYTPKDSSPQISFQRYEISESISRLFDPRGYCGAWCAWYAYQRIKSGIIMPRLIPKLLQKIRGNNIIFKNIIRNYANYIGHVRDNILKKSNLTLDIWFTDINIIQLKQIQQTIQKLI
jgi:ankyrin repeat protein